ncbi:MAG TPA: ATP-binding protein, partial [Burkholderiaceae bacterium]|nr:ATP-binding protein [Burkholderiaceae bacterium]
RSPCREYRAPAFAQRLPAPPRPPPHLLDEGRAMNEPHATAPQEAAAWKATPGTGDASLLRHSGERYQAPPARALAHGPSMIDTEFRRLLEALPAAAYTCDPDGLITYYNRRAREMWGRAPRLNDPADRYCGSLRLFLPDGTPLAHERCWMARALEERKEFDGEEVVIEKPDGTRHTALVHANPIFGDDGRLLGGVNVLIDITDRKRAETALRESDRAKTRFLAILAHELRNPLAPLRNALQLLRLVRDDAMAAGAARDIMERQLGQLVRLIDDLLDLSRISSGKIELRKARVDLGAVIGDALETSAPNLQAANLVLTVQRPDPPITLRADRTRLAQAIANVLNNAAKFTASGGQVWLTADREGDEAIVRVRDTGIGIRPESVGALFSASTPGKTDTSEGLGVGLSLVRELIALHGGSVEAHSEGTGLGSEFVMRLPIEAEAAAAARRGADLGGEQYRILIADDNRDSADSLALMLGALGHTTRVAYDGEEALEVAHAFRPQVALLDIGMPKLDGCATCRRLRAQDGGENILIAAITGWGREDDKRRSLDAGFNLHIVKPVDPVALAQLLDGLAVAAPH